MILNELEKDNIDIKYSVLRQNVEFEQFRFLY